MNQLLAEFRDDHPHITVRFEPSDSAEYDSVIAAQLAAGTAPDLLYLRSYSASSALFEQGYLVTLDDLPGLWEHFDAAVLEAWASQEGLPYAVPFTATSHGIYYNRSVFEDLGLEIPESWSDLMDVARALREAGITPFANGTKAEWTAAETIFMNLAPGFIGCREGRMAYLNGQRCFDDEDIVSAFQGVEDVAQYFPEDHHLLGYIDSLQLFVQGRAAMWMSGSWDIPYFEEADPDFAWSVFAVPPPAGKPPCVTFHLDVGIGLNAACGHKDEARVFLEWMTRPEFGALLGDEMPGFFPMHHDPPSLENRHANAFLALNEGRGTDIRFVWEKLGARKPSGYSLVQAGALDVINGTRTPQQAADALQEGLATWYEPARTCDQ
jgi:raffinose/stachyose/melibiose transport system substrate-binding protein